MFPVLGGHLEPDGLGNMLPPGVQHHQSITQFTFRVFRSLMDLATYLLQVCTTSNQSVNLHVLSLGLIRGVNRQYLGEF